jgi:hypothetical protein
MWIQMIQRPYQRPPAINWLAAGDSCITAPLDYYPTSRSRDDSLAFWGAKVTRSTGFMPARLKSTGLFEPCSIDAGDELYRNGIFEFNITKLSAFVEAQPERFAVEPIAVASIAAYGDSHLQHTSVAAADLSCPVLFAEIAPGRFNLIDGNHRVGKARREGVPFVMARKIGCPDHLAFLTATRAYEAYVEYWNGKVAEMQSLPRKAVSRRDPTSSVAHPRISRMRRLL